MSRLVYARVLFFSAILGSPFVALHAQAPAAQGSAAQTRQLGTVTAVDERALTLTTAAGTSVSVLIGPDAVVLQLPPGSTDLKSASPARFSDVAVGDRVLVSAQPGDKTHASRVVLMKSSAIAARNSTLQTDWQRRGTGGLVRAISGPEITVAASARTVKVMTTPTTVFRRYADDSIKFEDAKAGTLEQIQTGDQLRARGVLSEDRTSIAAEEVVSGAFENLSGAITSVDAAAGTLTLRDLVSKKTVVVKVTANSDLRKLPPEAAAAFAARNRRAAGAGGPEKSPTQPGAGVAEAAGGNPRRSAGSDLSQMLAHLPALTLPDVHAGDAVLIVASLAHGTELTAVTLLTGVEQILSAAPSGAAPITLSPWNIGTPDA